MKKNGSWARAALIVALLVMAAGGAGAWWLSRNADRFVKQAIEHYGSRMVGAKVTVEAVEIRSTGEGFVKGLVVGNPAGFRTPHAAKIGQFEIAVDRASLFSDVIRIRRIVVARPEVIYERGDGMTNFDAIERNIKAFMGPSSSSGAGGPKLVVDQLLITNPSVQASAAFLGGRTIPVTLPGVTLRDIGKSRGGVPPGELGLAVSDALHKRLTAAVDFDRIGAMFRNAAGGAVDTVKGLFK